MSASPIENRQPQPYTARDGMKDPETLHRWALLLQERAPGLTRAEREAMRARRNGTTPEAMAARRSARLAELARDAEAGGCIPVTGSGEPAVTESVIRVSLPDDDRPDWLVCVMCTRTLHKRKGRRVEVRPDVFACACCAGLVQDVPPVVLDEWMLGRRRYKRAAIVATYGTDPATLTAAETRTEITRMYADADGLPLGVTRSTAMTAANLVPVRTYFALIRERGRGVL